jgi:hypothetical protein
MEFTGGAGRTLRPNAAAPPQGNRPDCHRPHLSDGFDEPGPDVCGCFVRHVRMLFYMCARLTGNTFFCSFGWTRCRQNLPGRGRTSNYSPRGAVPYLVHCVWRRRPAASQGWRIVAAALLAGIDLKVSLHWVGHTHGSHALDGGSPIHLVHATWANASVSTTGRIFVPRPKDSSSRFLAFYRVECRRIEFRLNVGHRGHMLGRDRFLAISRCHNVSRHLSVEFILL